MLNSKSYKPGKQRHDAKSTLSLGGVRIGWKTGNQILEALSLKNDLSNPPRNGGTKIKAAHPE